VKGSLTLRLIVAAGIILVIYGAMFGLKAGIRTPEVVFPKWCHKDNDEKKELNINLPFQLGSWSGTKTELDASIFDATGAKIAENRSYSDDSGHTVSLHIGYYSDVEAGVWHSPITCYRCAGWQCLEDAKMPLAEGSPAPEVWFSKWDRESQTQCLVMHWYYLGGTIFYDRGTFGNARFALRGRSTWPPLVKVLIQNRLNATTEEDKESLLSFSKQIYQWLNEQEKGKMPTTAAKIAVEEPKGAANAKPPEKAK
jgi:EpsI family protein